MKMNADQLKAGEVARNKLVNRCSTQVGIHTRDQWKYIVAEMKQVWIRHPDCMILINSENFCLSTPQARRKFHGGSLRSDEARLCNQTIGLSIGMAKHIGTDRTVVVWVIHSPCLLSA